ncbi:MAG: hypothetical protein ACK46C_14160, partial [Flavobacteriales bacterium]
RLFSNPVFFQLSAFLHAPLQVISVDYLFRVHDPSSIPVVDEPFQGLVTPGGPEVFRWVPLLQDKEELLSLPIDRVVWRMLVGG